MRIYEDRRTLGAEAARMVAERIRALQQEQAFVNMIFAAAPSQREFLAALVRKADIDWGRINAFHMDEYIGLEKEAPQRFGNFLRTSLFDKVPFHAVHYLNDDALPIPVECERYTELLEQYPADITCMGIGENGHIAFNDPHVADFHDPCQVKMVALDNACRQQQVNDGCFARLEQVPTHALTLTIPALLEARYIYCMVPGRNKAQAVFHTLRSTMSEQYPSTALREHPDAILFLDDDSAQLIS